MIVIETIRDVAIAVALAILIPITFESGFEAFTALPAWTPEAEVKREQLREKLYQQIDELKQEKKFDEAEVLKKQIESLGLDAASTPFWDNYRKAEATRMWAYAKLHLPLGVILGILLIVITFFIPIMSIAAGFMLGGVACLVWALWPWWWYIRQPQLKFLILLGVVMALIALSYILFKRRHKSI